MKIGEKIKKLRTAKLMTQSDLVGNEITRNMLSRIENGAANPSLETINYIAARLNVSASYLLSEGADERMYEKHRIISDIKNAFISENYRICRDMCLNSCDHMDDEICMILCECDLALGREEFDNGRPYSAARYFDEALSSCSETVYRTDYIVAFAGTYFRYMERISAAITSNVIDESEVNVYPALVDEFCRYVRVLEKMDTYQDIDEDIIKAVGMEDSPYVKHLLAKKSMAQNKFAEAHKHLRAILLGDSPIPQPVLYFVFCDLEIACREIGDFKDAYEYSVDKIELMQKLLSRSEDYL